MPPTETLLSFLVATAVFAYMPGPAMLYTATQTIARGQQAGWMAATGIHLGGYVHVFAAAAGLSVLFTTVPVLFWIVKVLGATYLIWLGVKLFQSNRKGKSARSEAEQFEPEQAKPVHGSSNVFRDSAMVEILNPKTAVFYLAFLPQFTDVSATFPIWGQLLILGTLVNIAFSSADVLCVLLASTVTNTLNKTQAGNRYAQRAGGTLLVGLGIHMLLNSSAH